MTTSSGHEKVLVLSSTSMKRSMSFTMVSSIFSLTVCLNFLSISLYSSADFLFVFPNSSKLSKLLMVFSPFSLIGVTPFAVELGLLPSYMNKCYLFFFGFIIWFVGSNFHFVKSMLIEKILKRFGRRPKSESFQQAFIDALHGLFYI